MPSISDKNKKFSDQDASLFQAGAGGSPLGAWVSNS